MKTTGIVVCVVLIAVGLLAYPAIHRAMQRGRAPGVGGPVTQPVSAAAAEARRIADLIGLLGQDDQPKRQAAQQALVEAGPAAVPLLAEAVKDDAPQQAGGVRKALLGIEDHFGRGISTYNPGGVQDGPTKPTAFALEEPGLVVYISTYHFHNGRGAKAGTLALQHADGTTYGPWPVASAGGTGQAAVTWTIEPMVWLKPGRYTVVDSDPKTWSCNAQSGQAGFVHLKLLMADPAAGAPGQRATPWGEPSLGVQVRLRPATPGAAPGADPGAAPEAIPGAVPGGVPELLVDIRNRYHLMFSPAPPPFVEVEVDGVWYVPAPGGPAAVAPFSNINPGSSCHGWKVHGGLSWQTREKPGRPLDLAIGKHKLRLALRGVFDFGGGNARPVSDEIEIEVIAGPVAEAPRG